MVDVTNIPPAKPMWPTRPDDKRSRNRQDNDESDNKDKQPENNRQSNESDHDGQIDEYV